MGNIDTERLKSRVDLRELAGRLVELRAVTATEAAGPCPKCGGDDRFHVKDDTYFCRQCYPLGNGKPHDAIEFVTWAGLAPDFLSAVAYLGGGVPVALGPVRKPEAKPAVAHWQDADWQTAARASIAEAQRVLETAAGDPGRVYLSGRGLTPATWQAWGLGYDPAKYDPATARKRPAVVIPWQRDKVTAVKYRFLDSTGRKDRFTQKGGGQQIAFGLNLAGQHFGELWILEGELNAISLWQALRAAGAVNFDVVSIGSDSKAGDPETVIRSWAAKYAEVIVWADDPDKTAALMRALPGARGLRSPVIGGAKLDANELLKLGGLADFARAARWQFAASQPEGV
jgi:hypothetical protein